MLCLLVIGSTIYKVVLPKIKPESDLYFCVFEIFSITKHLQKILAS